MSDTTTARESHTAEMITAALAAKQVQLAAEVAAKAGDIAIDAALSTAEKADLIARVIDALMGMAADQAAAGLAALIAVITGNVPAPRVLAFASSHDRLQTAAFLIMEHAVRELMDPRPRVERLAATEVVDAGRDGWRQSMDYAQVVVGWKRQLDADPCSKCQAWAEGGRVFGKSEHFKSHPHCECWAEPVIRP